MSDTVRLGAWDCSDCGLTRNKGTAKVCARCGNPQDSIGTPAENFYLPPNAEVITDPTVLANSHLPAWNCGHCGTQNDGDATVCSFCKQPLDTNDTVNRTIDYDDMAPRHDAEPDPLLESVEGDLEKAERILRTKATGPRRISKLRLPASRLPRIGRDTKFYEDIRAGSNDRLKERMRFGGLSPILQRLYPYRRAIAIVLAVSIIVCAIAGIVRTAHYLTATVPGTVTISELHWDRKVEVEEYKTLTDSGWNYPGDARVLGSESKIRSYDTVHDGWRTESYTDYETRYRIETYQSSKTEYRSESYDYNCGYTRDNGNGTFTDVSRTCSGSHQVSYQVPTQEERQVPYQVPVQKTRQVEITHQEPVYDTWYMYQVDRWVTDRWVTASDVTSAKVIWPEPTDLSRNQQPGDQIGEERVGDDRSQSYTFAYTDANGSGRTERREDDALWSKLETGGTVPAHYFERNGDLSSVDWHAVS